MSILINGRKDERYLLMGNTAIARGALEAGVGVATGYPGTPSSEIIDNLAKVTKAGNLYVEWSVNEKVAMEVAAAASFAGLRSLCAMKQNGVNVGSDFLLHLAITGTRGGMVLVACDDPGALSSANEGESRHFARTLEIPLLEPGNFQELKDMIKWAFELSEAIHNLVMVRSVTRLSHASGNVTFGELPKIDKQAHFKYAGVFLDSLEGPIISLPVAYKHAQQQAKLLSAVGLFEDSPFNTYSGPENPELLVITSSVCSLYCKEAVHLLAAEDRVGLLKLGTTWPLPSKLMEKYLRSADRILIVEEVIPFLEENVKILAADLGSQVGTKTFFGKNDGTLPKVGELNPDLVVGALSKILDITYEPVSMVYINRAKELAAGGAPERDLTFCPGCPHRASFWAIHNALQMDNREGFVCGDIGCYSLAMFACGYDTLKTLHSMGSGVGLASGFGKLDQFGLDQPVLAVSGDSTFFHAVLPALVNAVHNDSDVILVVLDNSGTAMTGFQPHPGLPLDATGNEAPSIDIPSVCEALGASVKVADPFDLEQTQSILLDMLNEGKGVRVLVLRQICALCPEKKHSRMYEMALDEAICLGENCGCDRLCTRVFKCPGLIWDKGKNVTKIDEVICTGCGVCAAILSLERDQENGGGLTMGRISLVNDPYNVVIVGVGGQGNVLASRILGGMMSRQDLCVTIGETFGASQRGGSVMSHLRISSETSWSPQIPHGRAHLIVALEPIEAIRILRDYGHPETKVLCNSRPIHPVGVIAGGLDYPAIQDLKTWIGELSGQFWFVDATDAALELGDPVLGNVVMLGALAGACALPILREDFEAAASEIVPAEKVGVNLKAFDRGLELVKV